MDVGRKRKANPLGLEKRVYPKDGQLQYRHLDGHWEKLGTDVVKANEIAKARNNPGAYGTLGHWILTYISDAKARALPAGKIKSARTIEDYEEQAEVIKTSPLWSMYPQDIVRDHTVLGEYRDRRINPVTGKGKTRANRELSLISATFSWLIETRKCPGLIVNPVDMITRFREKPKERYVEDHEYQPVYGIAVRSVCMAMELVYRTLQRPSDVLALPPSAARTKTVAGGSKRIVTVVQGKTGRNGEQPRSVDIESTPAVDEALLMLSQDGVLGSIPLTTDGKVRKPVQTLVHTPDGEPYTEEGIGAMLRRYCVKAGVKTFGLMDIRAKGATDMYLDQVPLEHIQQLMGHASVQTTEIYIKRLLATVRIAKPNAVKVGGGAA